MTASPGATYAPAMKRALCLAALALTVSSCGGGSDEPTATKTVTVTVTATPTFLGDPTSAAPTPTASEDEDAFAPNVGDRGLKVGQPRVGMSVTTVVLETRLPYPPDPYRDATEGKEYLGLRVSQCISEDADTSEGDYFSTYPGEWYAVTPKGDQFTSSSSYNDWPSPKFPESVTLNPGECAKGWLTVEVPVGAKVDKLVWRPDGTTTAEWSPIR